jgi:3-hydroxyacyl-[acyl-carrier-protein] dehydratase
MKILEIIGRFLFKVGHVIRKAVRIVKERLYMLDIQQIKEIIPHRYPFLLIDLITEVEDGQRAVGIKNVTANEEFFNGHFPDYPVMPGVLIVEALAQVGAVVILKKEENRGRLAFFAGIDGFRFKGQVRPGDQLELEVLMTRLRGSIGKGHGIAKVNGQVVAEGDLMFALGDKKKE